MDGLIKSKDIKMIPIGEIKPWPKNRNQHPKEQIDRIVKLIEYQGFRNPLIISKQSGFLIAGHGRLLAAKRMKLEKVPVIFQDFESEDQAYAYMVSDNAVAAWADLDLSQINVDIQDLGPDFDIDMLGIKDFTIDVAEKNQFFIKLSDKFMIPPFTVFNAREGWWQERKSKWISLGIKSEKGRGETVHDKTGSFAESQERIDKFKQTNKQTNKQNRSK